MIINYSESNTEKLWNICACLTRTTLCFARYCKVHNWYYKSTCIDHCFYGFLIDGKDEGFVHFSDPRIKTQLNPKSGTFVLLMFEEDL